MIYQTTIKESVSLKGISVHSGKPTSITIHPAKANTGVMFKRIDVKSDYIKVSPYTVSSTFLSTTISLAKGVTISTIEHVMAALYCAGVDNALIDVDGDEVPVMDGSAKPFYSAIVNAGVEELDAKRKYMKIHHPVKVEDRDKFASIDKSDVNGLTVNCSIEYDNALIGKQSKTIIIDEMNIDKEIIEKIVSARTFGFKKDLMTLYANGLAKGAKLENAILFDDEKIVNSGGLRYSDEIIFHKILDLIGDVSLLGHRIIGTLETFKSGHTINSKLAKAILDNGFRFSLIELGAEQEVGNVILLKKQFDYSTTAIGSLNYV